MAPIVRYALAGAAGYAAQYVIERMITDPSVDYSVQKAMSFGAAAGAGVLVYLVTK